jgi:hypothetical protein
MLKIIFLFVIFITVVMALPYNSNKDFFCLYTNEPVKIDGELKEWNFARSIIIQDEKQKTNSNALIKTLWDNQNLYIAFQVQDDNLKAEQTLLDHPQLYLDDMAEFLLDTRNDKDSCWNEDDIIYHINLLGQKKDDRGSTDCTTNPDWNGKAEYAIKILGTLNDSTDVDTGYIVEIRISWKELDLVPIPGLRIGANFAVGDNEKLFDWINASPFRSPYAFGDLVLMK